MLLAPCLHGTVIAAISSSSSQAIGMPIASAAAPRQSHSSCTCFFLHALLDLPGSTPTAVVLAEVGEQPP